MTRDHVHLFKPFLDALRAVSGGTSPLELWSELGTLTLYGCTGAALARGVFRWNR